MDFTAIVTRLRPDVRWAGRVVNGHNLTTIAETYLDPLPIPTLKECKAEWKVLEKELRDNKVAKEARSAQIDKEKKEVGLSVMKLSQANKLIDDTFDGAASVPELREATKVILKKMAVYLLE
jgi:hypothetical protein